MGSKFQKLPIGVFSRLGIGKIMSNESKTLFGESGKCDFIVDEFRSNEDKPFWNIQIKIKGRWRASLRAIRLLNLTQIVKSTLFHFWHTLKNNLNMMHLISGKLLKEISIASKSVFQLSTKGERKRYTSFEEKWKKWENGKKWIGPSNHYFNQSLKQISQF